MFHTTSQTPPDRYKGTHILSRVNPVEIIEGYRGERGRLEKQEHTNGWTNLKEVFKIVYPENFESFQFRLHFFELQ